MEISADEISLLCRRISSSTQEYSLSGVYSIENGLLLRLIHSTKPEKLIAVSSFATWITTKNITLSEATPYVSRIRDQIERNRLVSVEAIGNERIAKFSLESRDGEKKNLYAEFFGGGNQILTEIGKDSEEIIIDVASPQRFRHRNLVHGEKYILPPSRGLPLQQITADLLSSVLAQSLKTEADSKISSVRWFGRNVGTSRKFVEEIFFMAGLDPELPASSLSPNHLAALALAVTSLQRALEQSQSGYLLLPENAGQSELEVDVCPLIPNKWKGPEANGLAKIQIFPTFNDALDEAQVQMLLFERKKKASSQIRARMGELESTIRGQESLIETNRSRAAGLREIGSKIMSNEILDAGDVVQRLESLEIAEKDKESGNKIRFVTDPRSFVDSLSLRALGSRLFDEAKKLEESNVRLNEIIANLSSQREDLSEQSELQEVRAGRKTAIERRPREWFERYRWFLCSDRRLVLGGRDATSNSVVINKYTNDWDVVFHADLYGSPFFVLKNKRPMGKIEPEIEDEIALEVAQATVSFSRAWRDELGSADAYWVYPRQIKKSAPSGEYLPRGSFFIEGKKNFVRHVKVELSVGIMTSKELPSENEEISVKQSESDRTQQPEQLVVVSGPERSLSHYCIATVRIAPGKEKASFIARKIKQELVKRIKEIQLKEVTKRISIDEIVRMLPSGSYKIVSEKQNR